MTLQRPQHADQTPQSSLPKLKLMPTRSTLRNMPPFYTNNAENDLRNLGNTRAGWLRLAPCLMTRLCDICRYGQLAAMSLFLSFFAFHPLGL